MNRANQGSARQRIKKVDCLPDTHQIGQANHGSLIQRIICVEFFLLRLATNAKYALHCETVESMGLLVLLQLGSTATPKKGERKKRKDLLQLLLY